MDIKPIKRRKPRPATQLKSTPGQKTNNITIPSKPNHKVKRKPKTNFKFNNFLAKNYIWIIAALFLSILYIPASKMLNSSAQYQNLASQAPNLDAVLNTISYGPQKLFILLIEAVSINGIFVLKICFFAFALLAAYLFFRVSLNWFGKNTALLATLLFSTSSWMILSSQNLSLNQIYLIFFLLIIFLHQHFSVEKSTIKIIVSVLLLSVVFYAPGMVWPILGMIVLLPIFTQKIIAKYNTEHLLTSLILMTILVLPLIVALILRSNNLLNILIGEDPANLQIFIQNLETSLEALFLNGLPDTSLWLVGTPILNYISALLFFFGLVYLFIDKRLRQHLIFLSVSLIFSLITIAFVGLTALSLIIPIVYLIVGFGIKLLLSNWYSIFPNNPVARNLGLSLVVFIVILSASYDIARYYIAWPKANDRISLVSPEKSV